MSCVKGISVWNKGVTTTAVENEITTPVHELHTPNGEQISHLVSESSVWVVFADKLSPPAWVALLSVSVQVKHESIKNITLNMMQVDFTVQK